MEKIAKKSHFPSSEHGIPLLDFEHWNIYLHPNQCYLGRCFLWARRDDAIDLMDCHEAEWQELRKISNLLKQSLNALFSPDLYNYAALGNVARHLHLHIIPRYQSPRIFQNRSFVDTQWGNNYVPYNDDFSIPNDMIQEITRQILGEMKHRVF